MNPVVKELVRQLTVRRRELKISRQTVALQCAQSPWMMSMIERGEVEPTMSVLLAYGQAVDKPLEWRFTVAPNEGKSSTSAAPPPPSFVIPHDVARVEGCNCAGSGNYHVVGCALQELPEDVYNARVKAAQERIRAWVAEHVPQPLEWRFSGSPASGTAEAVPEPPTAPTDPLEGS